MPPNEPVIDALLGTIKDMPHDKCGTGKSRLEPCEVKDFTLKTVISPPKHCCHATHSTFVRLSVVQNCHFGLKVGDKISNQYYE